MFPDLFELRPRLVLAVLLVATMAPRVALLPVNENLYGDAVPRTEFAERWARAPHVITSFGDGAAQYGPLHIYLIGVALSALDREDAGRAVSLVFGVLSVLPLFSIGRRVFGRRHAVVACLAFSVWGLHVQFSTTAASEAVSLFLMLSVFALLVRGRQDGTFAPIALAALALNLACAVRYDAWMFVPLLTVLPSIASGASRVPPGRALAFGLLCLPFPLLWMIGNGLAHGDPLYPLAFINQDHRTGVAEMSPDVWSEIWLRSQGIGFWPVIALLSLTPGVAYFAFRGIAAAWRDRPESRWIVLAAAAPIAYYAFRTAVLGSFVPLARFMATPLALLLPFVASGYDVCRRRWGPVMARNAAVASAALAVLMPALLGLYTFRQDGLVRDVLRPLSPTSTNSRAAVQAAWFLRAAAPGGSVVAIDDDPEYLDLAIAFFSRVPEERLVRWRWPGAKERFDQLRPDFTVRLDRGSLVRQSGVTLEGRVLRLGGIDYEEMDGFGPPVHVYRRQRSASAFVP
jgi:4-amino-4-deoxy-L-arabinose transferase-like glycosyltransferase